MEFTDEYVCERFQRSVRMSPVLTPVKSSGKFTVTRPDLNDQTSLDSGYGDENDAITGDEVDSITGNEDGVQSGDKVVTNLDTSYENDKFQDSTPKVKVDKDSTPKVKVTSLSFRRLLDAPILTTPKRTPKYHSPEPETADRLPLRPLSGQKRRHNTFTHETSPIKSHKRVKTRTLNNDSTFRKYKTEACIKTALSKENSNLIGDFSKPYILPTIPGKHSDLKSITPKTMLDLLDNKYQDQIEEFVIVDCRYPYEYEGGHLPGALNLYTHAQIDTLLQDPKFLNKRSVIVFHCEFSSERGPKMSRYLRREDRLRNSENYPELCHPEVYLLDGGYKNVFDQFPDGLTYVPMMHHDYTEELRHFRSKSKLSRKQSRRGSTDMPRVGLKF